jgi:hypothetical protein
MKKLAISLSLMASLSIIGVSTAAVVIIPLAGIEGYTNSITMNIPIEIVRHSSGFDTEHVYKVIIIGPNSTVFVFLRSYDAARPTDPLNVSADINIGYFESKNMHLVSDIFAQSKNCGPYREQEFGCAGECHMFVRTFMLDKKHLVFVMSPFDKAATIKMFESIVPGTYKGMFFV